MKYWEIVADGWRWIVDAHKGEGDGKRYILLLRRAAKRVPETRAGHAHS